ncbi:protein adenylyltransferase SelO [Roseibacillus ishigakijimensis]|uniref:Protein nucleotidyltransferase YdiU n=1 Tax=Roseibacillus ishigakijimensis TaxID=454146 RepID=A0A934VNN5_9BACT|nr:YdiU family protein [Roseibacillus ishigakijimensis]MBK1835502.1 YdiU family protein [Roseibacillus ishigakijimensis]
MSLPPIPFHNTYARLPERFFARQNPAEVPAPQWVHVNEKLAAELGIALDWLHRPEALAVFAGNAVAEGSEPLAQAYAGHQFGGFVPQLGDGRALLLGEVIDRAGQARDLQLKGSGRTPFSRQGDGKSALGPVLREYLLSEAMHALGVPTTRALAAVTTGETVLRQEGAVAGGVFTRVAASHLRVGTFQYFAAREDEAALRQLVDYALARHFPAKKESDPPALALLEAVIAAQARLIPHWMSLGFIHGVMNTDNCAISGETIDYGPCAFMEEFHPQCVFSSIDRGARYSWANQANIGLWNLTRLAEALLPLLDPEAEKGKELAEEKLDRYAALFRENYQQRFAAKLGLPSLSNPDFIPVTLEALAVGEVDFTLFFRHLTRVATGEKEDALIALFKDPQQAHDWLALWHQETHEEPAVNLMRESNPLRIPRNHQVEKAIQAGYRNDFTVFHHLLAGLAEPYAEDERFQDLEDKPRPEEVVERTFCGT